jgi:hypothetical protein
MTETANTLSDAQPEESQTSGQVVEGKPLKGLARASHIGLDPEPEGRYVWGGNHPDVPKMNEALFDAYAEQKRAKAQTDAEAGPDKIIE